MSSTVNSAAASSGANVQLDNVILDVWSQEILFQAQPQLRFESVCQHRTELGTMPGQTIKFLRFASLTGSPVLTEGTPMETSTIATSQIPITVGERGKALAFNEALLRYSTVDILRQASVLLGMHYAKERDAEIRNTLAAGTNVLYSQKGVAAASRADLILTSTFNVELVRDIAETLSTNKAPKFGGDAYICFVHPHQARYLRADPAWINAQNYATPDNILNGEIGRIEDVRFIETTMVQRIPAGTQDIFADNIDTTANTTIAANNVTDVYRAIAVGDYAVGIADALEVEMRDGGIIDFGRQHNIAWYAIYGAGLIETGHSVICETA